VPHFNMEIVADLISKKVTGSLTEMSAKELMALCGWRIHRTQSFFTFPDLPEPELALECVCCFRRFEVKAFHDEPELAYCPLTSHFKHCYFHLDESYKATSSVKEHAISILLSMTHQEAQNQPSLPSSQPVSIAK